jgi:heme exporter protein CcmD
LLRDFLVMGGYAGYVWSAIGVTLAVLAGLLVQSLWLVRRRDAELAGLRERLRAARPRPARKLVARREDGPPGGGSA